MNIRSQSLTHLPPTNISNSMQRQAIIQLIIIQQVLPNTINNQMQQLMLLMQKQRNGQIPNLLFRILGTRNQIHSLKMSEIHIISLDIDIEQLANVFLLLVPVQTATLELLSNVGQFLVHPFFLKFSRACIAQVRNELD